jgi:hypothetical protein
MGNCYADLYMSKPGTSNFGTYKDFTGKQTTQILRLGDTNQEYWFDKNGFNFTITKQDTYNGRATMEGIYSGVLHLASDTAVTQTANGSFRAYIGK